MDFLSGLKSVVSGVVDVSQRVLNDAEGAVSIAKEQITRYHEQARVITNRFFETSPESNRRLRRVLVRVPREDLADLFERHGVTAGSPEKEISELIHMVRLDGSNSIVTYAGRLGEGVNYDEIVRDVADKVEVKYNPKEVRTEADLEILIIQRIVEDAMQNLTPEERQEIGTQMKNLGDLYEKAWKQFLEAGSGGVLAVVRFFGPKMMFTVLKNFLMKFMALKTAGFVAFKFVGLVIPFVNLILWGQFVIDVAGPAYRKTVPTVFQIGLMRLEYGEEVER